MTDPEEHLPDDFYLDQSSSREPFQVDESVEEMDVDWYWEQNGSETDFEPDVPDDFELF